MARLLITGAAGGLGSELRKRLQNWQTNLRLSDVAPLSQAQNGEEVVQCDLADMQAVVNLVKGCDYIIHLGGVANEYHYEPILQANIMGIYNLYEAARQAGVKRILFASSNRATGSYDRATTIDTAQPFRPDSFYGVSKAYGETVARYYFDKYGIETACVRFGSCFAEPKDKRMLATWMSYDDMERMVKRIFEIKTLGFKTLYGVSNNKGVFWDNHLTDDLGWQPQDSSDDFAKDESLKYEATEIAEQLQGGAFAAGGHYDYNNEGARTKVSDNLRVK